MSVENKTPALDPAIFDCKGIVIMKAEEKQRRFGELTSLLVDPHKENRKKALKTLKFLCTDFQPTGKCLDAFKHKCEASYKREMDRMIEEHDPFWAELWQFSVKLVGAELHNVKGLLNSLLGIVEKALKKKDSELLVLAFRCWAVLIDNFALDADVISAPRRVELLVVPLKSKLAKDPASYTEKVYTWWHLIVKLKSNISVHFSTVVKPFFSFCFGPEGKDEHTKAIKLFYKVPSLSPFLLKTLTVILGTGIPGIQDTLLVPQDGYELPTVPIIHNSQHFKDIHKEAIYSVFDFVNKMPTDENATLAFMALASRVATLLTDDMPAGQVAMHELLTCLKDLISIKMNATEVDEIHYIDLLHNLVQALLVVWNDVILDTRLSHMSTTTREFLFGLMLVHITTMTTDLGTSVEKREERFIKMLGKVIDIDGDNLIAGPQHIANLNKLIKTLEDVAPTPEKVKEYNDQTFLVKMLSVWDQVGKMVSKGLPSESDTEECNALSKDCLMQLMILPLKWLIKYDSFAYTLNVNNLLTSWKQVLHKYVSVSKLSISLNKCHPFTEVCNKILELLTENIYQTSTISALMFISSQFVALRNSPITTSLRCDEEELSELPLMSRIASLLSQQVAANDPRTGKTAKQLAKTLQSLMITQSNVVFLLGIFKVFFTLLMIPIENLNIKDEHLAEMWNLFAYHFTDILIKRSPGAETRETKILLKELLPNLVQLKLHKNIKVQQGAMQLEDAFNTCIHKTNQRVAAVKTVEEQNASPKGFAPPSQSMLSFKRGRRSVANVTTAPRPSSPAPKPVLEDQDSQDFVKIPAKPKAKKVLTVHQKESKRRRRDDIPALYQGLSQDTFNSDTQDTQDSPMDIAPPSFSSSIPIFSEDAIDMDISSATKCSQEAEHNHQQETTAEITTVAETLRPILEPIQVESESNKNSQESDMEGKENPSTDQSFAATKPEILSSPVKQTKNKDNINVESTVVTDSNPETGIDEEVIFISESPRKTVESPRKTPESPRKTPESPRKNTEAARKNIVLRSASKKSIILDDVVVLNNKEKENLQTVQQNESQDTQDDEIVENSQLSATLPVTESKAPKEDTSTVTVSSAVPKVSRPLRNRQGVTLQTRSARTVQESSHKEKSPAWPLRHLSGRAAQLLGMVAANSRDTSPTSSDSRKVSQSPPVEVVDDKKDDSTNTATIISESFSAQATSNEDVNPIASTSNEATQPTVSPIRKGSIPEECSPERNFTLFYASTPTTSTPLSKRSNLKRNILDVSGSENNTTPSPKKMKRVSFAEPIVSGALESPKILSEMSTFNSLYKNNSPKSGKKKENRVSRKLLLVAASNTTNKAGTSASSMVTLRSETITSQGTLSVEEYAAENEEIEVISPEPNLPEADEMVPLVQESDDMEQEIVSVVQETDELQDTVLLPQDTVPMVQEPDDAEGGKLQEQLKILIEQHSLQEVLKALGQHGETTESVLSVSMSSVPTPPEEAPADVFQRSLENTDRADVLATLAQSLSPSELMQVMKLQNENMPTSDTAETEKPPLEEFLQASGRSDELLTHVVQNFEPSYLIEKLENAGKSVEMLNFILAHFDLPSILEIVSESVQTGDVIQALRKDKEVLNYILLQSSLKDIVAIILKKFTLGQLLDTIRCKSDIVDYILDSSQRVNIIEKASKGISTPSLIKAVNRQDDILDYTLRHTDKRELLKNLVSELPVADIVNAVTKDPQVLESVIDTLGTQEILLKINRLPMPELLQAIGRENEVLDVVMDSVEPVALMRKASLVLKDGDLSKIIVLLEPAQQEEVCTALPKGLIQKEAECMVTIFKDERESMWKKIAPYLSTFQIADELVRRLSNNEMTCSDLPAQLKSKITAELSDDGLIEALNHKLGSGGSKCDTIIKVVKHIPCSDLLEALIDNAQNLSETELHLMSELISHLSPAFIVQQVQIRLNDKAHTDGIKQNILKLFSNNELLSHIDSQFKNNESDREAACQHMLEKLPVHKVLTLTEAKLMGAKTSKQTLRILQNILTNFLPQLKIPVSTLTQDLNETEKFEVLEQLVSMIAIKDVMAHLPIRDVIQYYEKLVTMDEYRGTLIRTTLENVEIDDLIRFIGPDKYLKALKAEMKSKTPKITPSQVATHLPDDFVTKSFAEQLAHLPESNATLKLLKTNFPRGLLGKLVSELLLSTQTKN